MELNYATAFLLGLLSAPHCIGMCGGIIGALSFGLPPGVRGQRWRMLPYLSAYSLGRVTSYTFAGILAGTFGEQVLLLMGPESGRIILLGVATIILVAIGLYLAGWFPHFAVIERIGRPVWRVLEPIGRRLIPVKTPGHAFLYGLVWGWLPCGLIYSALLWTTTTGSGITGGLVMLTFGAGTLPAVLTAGIFSGWMARMAHHRLARPLIGLTIIALALATLWLALQYEAHAGHDFRQRIPSHHTMR